MGHEEYKEMLMLHALGALETAEERSLEAHLATCDECRAELAEWLDTASALAHAAAPIEPSVELRARILESARASIRPASEKTTGDGESGASEASSSANVIQFTPAARRSDWSARLKWGALAASLAFVALIILLLILWNRNNAMREEIARLSQRNDELQAEVTRLTQRNDEMQTQFANLTNRNDELQSEIARLSERSRARPGIVVPTPSPLLAPDVQTIALAGTNIAPGARATITYDRRTGSATFSASNLPPAPAGKTYQLWFIVGGKPISGGIFRTDAAGGARVRTMLPAEGRAAGAPIFAVTLEPQGGVNAPTGEKYLLSAAS